MIVRYRQSEYVRIFRIDDSEMDAFMLLSSSKDIVRDEIECLEVEKFWSVDGESIGAKFVTKIYSSIDFFIIEIIRCLNYFDRKLVFLWKFFDIIYFPCIEIFPYSQIKSIETSFFYKIKDKIQSISGKGIGAE